jgi:hypothetical protein
VSYSVDNGFKDYYERHESLKSAIENYNGIYNDRDDIYTASISIEIAGTDA